MDGLKICVKKGLKREDIYPCRVSAVLRRLSAAAPCICPATLSPKMSNCSMALVAVITDQQLLATVAVMHQMES